MPDPMQIKILHRGVKQLESYCMYKVMFVEYKKK